MNMLKKLNTEERTYLAEGLALVDTNREKETMPLFIKDFETKTGGRVMYLSVTGSILHGTSSVNSDSDYKGVYIPSMRDLILNEITPSISISTKLIGKNSNEDIDVELYSIFEFFRLCSSMETNTLEILFSMFSNELKFETEESKLIKDNYELFLSNNIEKLVGFAMSIASRYTIKGERLQELSLLTADLNIYIKEMSKVKFKTNPISFIPLKEILEKRNFKYVTIENLVSANERMEDFLVVFGKKYPFSFKVNVVAKGLEAQNMNFGKRTEKAMVEGLDYKAFSHAFRAIWQSIEVLNTGFIKFPLTYADELKRIKFSKTLTKEYLSDYLEEEYWKLMTLKDDKTYAYDFIDKDDQTDKLKNLKMKVYEIATIKKEGL